jgi:2-haloacid dehalogenase
VDLTRFDALTFDCYGTLIDWERGILAALRPWTHRHGVACDDEYLLARYAAAEATAESGPWRPYREVLAVVLEQLATDLGVRLPAGERELLARSVGDWPPFPDTVAALRALGGRYRLAIVSNVDDALFVETANRQLHTLFDQVITAEQVRSYKPAPAHFHEALKRLGLDRTRVLHVAQSLYHDIAPARALGLTTVWVNRRAGRAGPGATPPAETKPDLEVFDLNALVTLSGLMQR